MAHLAIATATSFDKRPYEAINDVDKSVADLRPLGVKGFSKISLTPTRDFIKSTRLNPMQKQFKLGYAVSGEQLPDSNGCA